MYLRIMAPFRWANVEYDIQLAVEVTSQKPEKPADWEVIAEALSKEFSKWGKQVEIKGRGCKERMERIIAKFKTEDKRSLKR
jgi:hypothetical protein